MDEPGAGRERILILGGLGYVGARLLAGLAPRAEITATARHLSPAREALVDSLGGGVGLACFDSERDESPPGDREFDVVINLAMPSAAEAGKDEERGKKTALKTLEGALSMLLEGRCARLIHFSTFHVYGRPGASHYGELDEPAPLHAYGRIHAACEKHLHENGPADSVVIVRPTNIVGRPAHADLGPQRGLIYLDLCRQAIQEGKIELRNNGMAYRDFVGFPDFQAGLEVLLQARSASGVFNIGRGVSETLRALAERIARGAGRLTGRTPTVSYGDAEDCFNVPFTVDVSRMKALGWEPAGLLEGEVLETLEFFR